MVSNDEYVEVTIKWDSKGKISVVGQKDLDKNLQKRIKKSQELINKINEVAGKGTASKKGKASFYLTSQQASGEINVSDKDLKNMVAGAFNKQINKAVGDFLEIEVYNGFVNKFKTEGIEGPENLLPATDAMKMLFAKDPGEAIDLVNKAKADAKIIVEKLYPIMFAEWEGNKVKQKVEMLLNEKIAGGSTDLGYGDLKMIVGGEKLIVLELKNYSHKAVSSHKGFKYLSIVDINLFGDYFSLSDEAVLTYYYYRGEEFLKAPEQAELTSANLPYWLMNQKNSATELLQFFLAKGNLHNINNLIEDLNKQGQSIQSGFRSFCGVERMEGSKNQSKIYYWIDLSNLEENGVNYPDYQQTEKGVLNIINTHNNQTLMSVSANKDSIQKHLEKPDILPWSTTIQAYLNLNALHI